MQKVNLTCWSLQPSPKEQPQDKNKIINETREDCVLNRPMVHKEKTRVFHGPQNCIYPLIFFYNSRV